MNIRDAFPPPASQEVFYYRQHPVAINHPGRNLPLLRFPALSTGSPTTPYGVFRPLVLDACRVLTNHASNTEADGDYLASDREGRNRVEINDTPLDFDRYYFLGAPDVESSRNYPIVKTLSACTFPAPLPDRWARVADAWRQRPTTQRFRPEQYFSMAFLVEDRDKRCVVTQHRDCTQCAHLIPEAEEPWFVHMLEYLRPPRALNEPIHHPANGILLRADVRLCFDAHAFVFYPIHSPAAVAESDGDAAFAAYSVGRGFAHMPDLFHRRRVALHPHVPVELLYARFAYTVIRLRLCEYAYEAVPELPRVVMMRESAREWRRCQAARVAESEEASD